MSSEYVEIAMTVDGKETKYVCERASWESGRLALRIVPALGEAAWWDFDFPPPARDPGFWKKP